MPVDSLKALELKKPWLSVPFGVTILLCIWFFHMSGQHNSSIHYELAAAQDDDILIRTIVDEAYHPKFASTFHWDESLLTYRAMSYDRLNQVEEADADYTTALSKFPYDLKTRLKYLDFLSRRYPERLDKIELQLDKIEKIYPKHPEIVNWLDKLNFE